MKFTESPLRATRILAVSHSAEVPQELATLMLFSLSLRLDFLLPTAVLFVHHSDFLNHVLNVLTAW